MCNKELLVTYVYDELQGPERLAFEEHLATCPSCRSEVEALRDTRVHLSAWTPQEPDLRFQIVRGSALEPSRVRWVPAWALAAAAVLVLAVAAAIANVEVSTSGGGITVRTGWSRSAETPAAAPDQSQEMAKLQERLLELETALAKVPAAQSVVPVSTTAADDARGGDTEILRRVRQMIADSDARQEREFANRLIGVMRELQVSHTSDLVRLQQMFNQNQGVINDEVFRQREEMRNLYRFVGSQR